MMLGTMRLVVLRAFPLVKGYGANHAVRCDGVLAFVEAQYNLALCSRAARTRSVRGSIPVALPDQRFDTAGQSLASPLSSGVARMLNNNYNLYAALDQPLWQESEGAGGLNAFLRVMGAPGDRNLVDFYFDTVKARSGERTTRSASASPIHGSAARRARSMPIRPRRRRPIRCDRAKRCWRLATNSRSPADGSCSPISSTSSIRAAAFPTPTPRRGGSPMPQCSG